MNYLQKLAAFTATVIALAACQKETQVSTDTEAVKAEQIAASARENEDESRNGNRHVYTISNQVSSNAVMDYKRASNEIGRAHV